jgi:hypothetical protein
MMMINIKRLLYTPIGKIFISIVLGLGIASLFRRVCTDRNCLVFNGPVIDEVDGRIFKYGEDCYKYKQRATSCDSGKKIIDISPLNAENGEPTPSSLPSTMKDVSGTTSKWWF